jgi:hypothetical protein
MAKDSIVADCFLESQAAVEVTNRSKDRRIQKEKNGWVQKFERVLIPF